MSKLDVFTDFYKYIYYKYYLHMKYLRSCIKYYIMY